MVKNRSCSFNDLANGALAICVVLVPRRRRLAVRDVHVLDRTGELRRAVGPHVFGTTPTKEFEQRSVSIVRCFGYEGVAIDVVSEPINHRQRIALPC